MGYPPPNYTEQHSEHLLRGGRCASCVHAGGLSFIKFVIIWTLQTHCDGTIHQLSRGKGNKIKTTSFLVLWKTTSVLSETRVHLLHCICSAYFSTFSGGIPITIFGENVDSVKEPVMVVVVNADDAVSIYYQVPLFLSV